ncbi:hypothetical protein SAMN06265365_102313 [Tistlia consotensis]|uniref:Uncharacterized protein n=1 Tax=Tistlia consotensis USBA 355 TaxID=560819 RepID=A0A1Y6BE22_9PROT|nr:hypothetical protein [Tistlia consotensis]SMF06805.1 hypothetical protein SAMN05428998_1043 [Tistlia consotensis USBA 355]SNR36297.1 hypothetical protein SAMN06265365_102313 [Tistlia consotensis]
MRVPVRQQAPDAAAGGLRALLPALVLLLVSLLVMPALAVRLPSAGQEVALVFPPGTSSDAAIGAVASADGLLVRPGGFDNLMIARFPHALGWLALWRLGVVVALDPAVAGACAAFLQSSSKGAPS